MQDSKKKLLLQKKSNLLKKCPMKKTRKMKVLLGILLLLFCVAGIANDNCFVKEKGAEQKSASVITGGLLLIMCL